MGKQRQSPHWKEQFVFYLSVGVSVSETRKHLRVSERRAYSQRAVDTDFAHAWNEAVGSWRSARHLSPSAWISPNIVDAIREQFRRGIGLAVLAATFQLAPDLIAYIVRDLTSKLSPDEQEAFWSFVERRSPSDCWPWSGPAVNGWGQFLWRGRMYPAAYIAYLLDGKMLAGTQLVLPSCGTAGCVNPGHLAVVSTLPTRDHGYRLSSAHIQEIRTYVASGIPQWLLSEIYCIDISLISKIMHGTRHHTDTSQKEIGGPSPRMRQRAPELRLSNALDLSNADLNRFWSKVDTSGGEDACWIWVGKLNKGSGQFAWGGTVLRAHRVSYQLTYGPIPLLMWVRQICGNRRCVNPAHLRLESTQRFRTQQGT